jgi:O-methyltransferase involved in polyketide biosynthesis
MIEHGITLLNPGQNIQIVALGSGLETLWFNLMDQGFDKNKFRFIELDLEVVVKRKIRKIKHSKKINALIDRLKLTPSTTCTSN